ncbi:MULTISPECIES: LysR family transcriptional regulator [Acidithrix]|uniref:HTH-type transcriptional activator CmpR n=1 Tax=Acidithrix ferrooxidans TaxID=1280514 RepID=A0A0D8HKJ9_9ACTN|nr:MULTISPECIES: LysR family transcriptional regulator [Acidithrix]KJF18384.1 HTH-type transcriptional activator CmpR [Acidithrix ferrooxidans]CAG4920558.1 unnamed protein product [Acidithrix sp. C25]
MTFNQLRTLVAVVQNGSITGAADELYLSQSAVSSSIYALRDELGIELFSKSGRNIEPTPACLVLYKQAKVILGMAEKAKIEAIATSDTKKRILRMASVTTAGEALLPRWIRSYIDSQSDVEIRSHVENRSRVFELLESHSVDLVIAGRPPLGMAFKTLAVRPHKLMLVASANSEIAKIYEAGGDVTSLLARSTWLMREEKSGTRKSLEELLDLLAISPRMLTIGSNVALREAVALDIGVTLLSSDTVSTQLEMGILKEINVPPLPIVKQWHITSRDEDGVQAEIAANFANHLIEHKFVSALPS